MLIIAFWVSGQFLVERVYTLLIFAGAWALMSGIVDIVKAFQIRRVGKLIVKQRLSPPLWALPPWRGPPLSGPGHACGQDPEPRRRPRSWNRSPRALPSGRSDAWRVARAERLRFGPRLEVRPARASG